jgi:hypothetical protein
LPALNSLSSPEELYRQHPSRHVWRSERMNELFEEWLHENVEIVRYADPEEVF